MNPQITIKVLILAASAMSPLIAFKISHTLALIAARVFDTILKDKPLPPLTDVVLIKFAGSNMSLGLGLFLTIFILIAIVTWANPKQPGSESTKTLQIFLAFIGPFVSTIYLGTVLLATLLPLTPMGHALTRSAEQDAAARP